MKIITISDDFEDMDEFKAYLAEGFHTAFRKGTDCKQAMPIHKLISKMDDQDWNNVISFVVDNVFEKSRSEKGFG